MLIVAAAIMLPAPAFSQPPIPIPTCPYSPNNLTNSITSCCKITKAGLYEVDNDLIASVPSVDCLVITAPNVTLNLNHSGLIGATSAVGIHIMKTAAKAFIEGGGSTGGSTIENFGEGIQIDAPGALVDNFTVLSNTDAGVLLNHVQQADLSNFYAIHNLNDGVRIGGGGNNVLQMPTIYESGRYGVSLTG